ncbi:MAG: tail fiber domain-containing protein [Acidobacteria bacterium]|nr:tail fiber domain-containing protein [Acidobacteriota bacterium]
MIAARLVTFGALLVVATATAEAQPVGTFRWQLEPHCNVLTLSITRAGEVYRLDGTDDQCGGEKASIVGTASVASGGDIGLGMSIVTTPGAIPVHLRATLSLSSLSGTWQDSAGNAGAFVPTTTAGSGGSPRPASALGAAVITASTVQRRISGSCPGGQFISAIAEDGRVSCTTAGGGTITRVVAGTGLYAVGGTQAVSLYFRPESIETTQGVIARSTSEADGTGPISGQGRFFAWHARKGAVRAGRVLFFPGQWDDRTTGHYSVGLGRDARAYGDYSTAIGEAAIADGQYSVALVQGYATATAAVAIGRGGGGSGSHGTAAFSAGLQTAAGGPGSVALGTNVQVPYQVPGSFVFGDYATLPESRMVGGANQFNVRANSFVEFFSDAAATVGVRLDDGSWNSTSDRRLKQHFRALDGERVLAKLARLPIREWNYITQDASIRHLGPTAQDFRASFGLGESPRQISTVDADGIALAALQAIATRTESIAGQQRDRRRENADVGARLDRLERLLGATAK